MAIKVVQGLIDVSAPEPIRSASRASGEVVDSAPSLKQQISSAQQQATVVSQTAAQVIVNSEAAINAVRLRSTATEAAKHREEIRDPEEATDVAESVADRVTEDEEEALDAHQTLSSSTAREHFTH